MSVGTALTAAAASCTLAACMTLCAPPPQVESTSGLVSLAGRTSTISYGTPHYKAASSSEIGVAVTEWPGGCTDSLSMYLTDVDGTRVSKIERWTHEGERRVFVPRDGTSTLPGGQVYYVSAFASGSWDSCDSDDADAVQEWFGDFFS